MSNHITMEFVTDPEELAAARKRREQFDRNAAWLEKNASQIYRQNRGKVICIAGQELFVGETVQKVIAKATAGHPDDAGRFVRYISEEDSCRVVIVRPRSLSVIKLPAPPDRGISFVRETH